MMILNSKVRKIRTNKIITNNYNDNDILLNQLYVLKRDYL